MRVRKIPSPNLSFALTSTQVCDVVFFHKKHFFLSLSQVEEKEEEFLSFLRKVTTVEDEEQEPETELEPEALTVLEETLFTQIPHDAMLKIWNFVDFDGLTRLAGLFLQFSKKKNSIFFFFLIQERV